MNDLLSRSFSAGRTADIEMGTSSTTGTNLESFFKDVEVIKEELKAIEALHEHLQKSNEQSKTLHKANEIKTLRTKMDNDVSLSLKKAKFIKNKLELLDKSNVSNRSEPGCGPGSSTDRTRTSVVNGLRKQLQTAMKSFNELRQKLASEHRETVQRRYYTVTGENPDEATVDNLISSGQSETFLQKAIQEQGRGQVMETILEIQERHDAVTVIERNLKELHQVFMDMAVLVEHQGAQLDDIESHVNRANSYVVRGTSQLNEARKKQKNTRKWTCFAILLLLIIIAIIVISIRPWK
ncbi:Syntaxin/epimorphin, conserved site-containing protein [Artemisia annua]|uniref:Syntaxin/epimorphin, conserved site-containing protein n=1 Tax=Artemisia annua TaxID=35608 RepID=A0A2U1LGE7_ARTAN|nr:Syntaxin/epimorphin, conserved site-containing protein [Artemisia annua]